jgi:hypothetical protein
MLLALSLAAVAPSSPCHIEAARYVLRADPTVTARFHIVPRTRDWTWGVALELHLAKTGRTSWWLPFLGGTSDVHGLRWTARRGTAEAKPGYRYNLGDLQYFAFDKDYGMINTTPMRGDWAPDHILLNDLRDKFWYADDPRHRSSPPRSLFDLAGCTDEAADDIKPRADLLFPPIP